MDSSTTPEADIPAVAANQIQVKTNVNVSQTPRIMIALGAFDDPAPLFLTTADTFRIASK